MKKAKVLKSKTSKKNVKPEAKEPNASKSMATKKLSPKKKAVKKSGELADSLYMQVSTDPAHSPGHRRMNLKNSFDQKKGAKTHPQNQTALNKMTRAGQVQRTSSANRRIITGAAIGKTGRITMK